MHFISFRINFRVFFQFLQCKYLSSILMKNKGVEQGKEANGHTVVSDASQVSGGAAEMQ